ncbi:hypothetical protein NC652_030648 [Populus alba x Populus x berolinensis]|nr:hypothetical protein NC652_030648 [Populus alba x Populus x berolinensis]
MHLAPLLSSPRVEHQRNQPWWRMILE